MVAGLAGVSTGVIFMSFKYHRDTCQAMGTLNLLKILTPRLWGAMVKNPPANSGDARDLGSIPGSGRSPGEGNGNPLQNSCLRNPMDRGPWGATHPTGSQRFGHDLANQQPQKQIICTH